MAMLAKDSAAQGFRSGERVTVTFEALVISDGVRLIARLPNGGQHDGYMITIGKRKIRVACEAPRTDGNYMRVDAAIQSAIG